MTKVRTDEYTRSAENTLPHEQAAFDLAKRGVLEYRPLTLSRADLGVARMAYDLAPLIIASLQAGHWRRYDPESHPRFCHWRQTHSETQVLGNPTEPAEGPFAPELQAVVFAVTDWLTGDGQRVFDDCDDCTLTFYGTNGEQHPADYAGVYGPFAVLAGVMAWVEERGQLITRDDSVCLSSTARGPRKWDSSEGGTGAFGSILVGLAA
ncbi:hypothetical protein RND64_20235 [Gordonia sp. w5E2]|uniref:hypothetical protein n=1 Tax=Gordonia TaxID=2053 RepID=UPI0022E2BA83|nr:hypothetical protein [Gordonia jacobaea]